MSLTLPTFVTCKLGSDPKSFRPVKIQKTPDLPFVKNHPSWGTLKVDQELSYYLYIDRQPRHIEFINNQWYNIYWNLKRKQFLTAKDTLIHQTTCTALNLPTWSPEDPFCPKK
jgi:hypothetical protein